MPGEVVEDIEVAVLRFGPTLEVSDEGHVTNLAGPAFSKLLKEANRDRNGIDGQPGFRLETVLSEGRG